ncbi:MAG: hypothetical protein RLZZ238_836 [Planctomycetota bacterium]
MGSPETEKDRRPVEVQHKRVIGEAFYLSQNEVSQAEWRAIAGSDPGSWEGDDLPVESVSWHNIREDFLAPSRGFFRLPSEAEWEYACRAGTTTAFSFGETITEEQVCFNRMSMKPVACGSLPANPWGFHEMHGNVSEWVEDVHSAYPKEAGGQEAVKGGASTVRLQGTVVGRDGQAVVAGGASTYRVLRGGSWLDRSFYLRSSYRTYFAPSGAFDSVGFRVARAPL